uniref:Putative tick salivary metalloprotease n=1 Tax=Rhipicephalus pulchellus TaxID=72859 RepID=L7LQH2_RHIPC
MRFVGLIILVILSSEGSEMPRRVYPRLLEERSSDGRIAMRVHEGLTLNLRRATVAAPKVRVLAEENGKAVTQFYDGEDINKNLYEDEVQLATVEVIRSDKGVSMRGLVGPHHRIQPMPVSERSEEDSVPHMIYKIDADDMLDKTLKTTERSGANISERTYGRQAQVPDTIIVEVFIVTGKRHFAHYQQTSHLIWYACIMVNYANLRLSAVTNPMVKLVLVGLEKDDKESYAMLTQDGYLFDELTIKAFQGYAVKRRTDFGRPDVVFLLSGYDVITIYNGQLTDAGLGIGFLSGICTDHYVALGEDKPGLFTGAHTFTHELAHLLGASHDGEDAKSDVPGHPSSTTCPWDQGFIMSYVNIGPSHHRFSPCSVEQIRHVLTYRGSKCWYFSGNGYSMRGTYPGMTVSFERFCMGLVDNRANITIQDITVEIGTCKVLCTYRKRVYNRYDFSIYEDRLFQKKDDALDYMKCGNDKVCIQGYCVTKPPEATDAPKTPEEFTRTVTAEVKTKESVTESASRASNECECDCLSTTTGTVSTRRTTTPMPSRNTTRRFFKIRPWSRSKYLVK